MVKESCKKVDIPIVMIILEGNEQMMIRSAGITVLGLLFCFSSVVLAAEISPKQDDLVTRIRNAEQVKVEENTESIQERINKIMEAAQKPAAENSKKLPQVAVMYVNNAKTTYDDEVDKRVFKYLNQALPAETYDLVDGTPYMEKLKQMGYEDVAAIERSDVLDAYAGSGIDYCVYLEVQPVIARDKITLFTIGKDITTTVPLKIIDLGTGKYVYNGKFTEKASDSTVFGDIGNKSVAMKVLDTIGAKMLKEIDARLPKEKTTEK